MPYRDPVAPPPAPPAPPPPRAEDAGIRYEPRALWSVQRFTPPAEGSTRIARFNKEHFRNGTRHPIVLTHMLVGAIGYTLDEFAGINVPPTAALGDRHACAAAAQEVSLFIRAPRRQAFTRRGHITPAWAMEPADDISMLHDPNFGYSHGLLNVCRWDFEYPMELPGDHSLDFKLGGFLAQPSDFEQISPPAVFATVAFFEDGLGVDRPGSFFKGNNRSLRANLDYRLLDGFPFTQNADGLGGQSPTGAVGSQWPFRFTPAEYRRQQQSRVGASSVRGFAVAIEQALYDDEVQNSLLANVVGEQVAPLSLRVPCYARVADGGTKIEWWREGAPLALVCPSLTPAQVYRLARPITLHKGDVLDIELETPAGIATAILPAYQIGVSFCGYAEITG